MVWKIGLIVALITGCAAPRKYCEMNASKHRWAQKQITVVAQKHLCNSITHATRYWNKALQMPLFKVFCGLQHEADVVVIDGHEEICTKIPPNMAAATIIDNLAVIDTAVIVRCHPRTPNLDVAQSIWRHEFGHVLGLDHSDNCGEYDLMLYTYTGPTTPHPLEASPQQIEYLKGIFEVYQ